MHDAIVQLIGSYGVWFVAAIVAFESMGLPVPGETTLVSAALYAGSTGRLDIVDVVTAAAAGAIAGDNVGFWIGREIGRRWLVQHGDRLRLTPSRLKLGQYLFARHGGTVVFFGRFVAVLRAFAALLAGVNRMGWRPFLLFNATGGVAWAAAYGFGAYVFGRKVTHLVGPLGAAMALTAIVGTIAGVFLVRTHERQLAERAERAFPGPLRL